jgi:hypothetical protein
VRFLVLVGALGWATAAAAAPAADLVVFHAPSDAGPDVQAARDAMAGAAHRRGAAWIDASPAPPVPPETAQEIRQGTRDYDQLQFDAAIGELDRAAAELDRTGGAGLDAAALGDLFLYRGLARMQTSDARAWDDLVEAAALAPARVLDPARFPPRAIEAYTRAAAAALAAPRATLTVRAPDKCAIAIDGAAAATGAADVVAGRHFVAVRCPGRLPWGAAVTAASGPVPVDAQPALEAPPTDDELVIQARTAGVTSVVAVIVAGGARPVAVMRRLGADGRALDRSSVSIGKRADDAGEALDHLLAPPVAPPPPARWYERRWVWAAGGAAAVAAVLVPILVFRAPVAPSQTVTLDPKGIPW